MAGIAAAAGAALSYCCAASLRARPRPAAACGNDTFTAIEVTNQHADGFNGSYPDTRKVNFNDPGNGKGPLPLVLGLSGDMASGLDVCGRDLEDPGGHEYSDAGLGIFSFDLYRQSCIHNFVAACPDMIGSQISAGRPGWTQGNWNAGSCCSPATGSYPDVGFIRSTIEQVKSTTGVSQVYAMGLSGGGQLAWRLGCEAHDIVDGVVITGGAWFGAPSFVGTSEYPPARDWEGVQYGDCTASADGKCWSLTHAYPCSAPTKDFRILFVMGAADDEEPYNTSVAMFKHYATAVLGCTEASWAPLPSLEKYGNASAAGNSDGHGYQQDVPPFPTTCFRYESCSTPAKPALCSIQGMGHHIPTRQVYDLQGAMWEWFGS